jgi:hypothetical protein
LKHSSVPPSASACGAWAAALLSSSPSCAWGPERRPASRWAHEPCTATQSCTESPTGAWRGIGGGTGDERENLAWFGPARVRVRNAYGPNGPGWDTACIRVRGVLDRDVVSRFESGACKLEQ